MTVVEIKKSRRNLTCVIVAKYDIFFFFFFLEIVARKIDERRNENWIIENLIE